MNIGSFVAISLPNPNGFAFSYNKSAKKFVYAWETKFMGFTDISSKSEAGSWKGKKED